MAIGFLASSCLLVPVRSNFQVGVRHPNIWVFIRFMKDEQRHCQRQLGAAERGAAQPSRK